MKFPPGLLGDKYEVLAKLGEGGMGAVYKVRHVLLDDVRVAKVIRKPPGEDPTLTERFHLEARTAIRLRHPGIAQLYDFSVADDGTAVIVMEFIDGVTVLELLRKSGPPELGLTIEIALQGLEALGYLHEMGYVHRDVSPDNLMLTRSRDGRGGARLRRDGRPVVKLIDLGLAKRLDSSLKLTQTGTYLGKVRYSAPEQFGDGTVDERSDIYSFGVLLYELLTGVLPITGEQFSELVGGHLVRPPRDFAETDPEGRVPADLRAVVMRTLEKEPAARFASAAELARRLEPFQLPYQSPFSGDTAIITPSGGPPAPAALATKAVGEELETAVTVKTGGALPPSRTKPAEKKRTSRRTVVLGAAGALAALLAAAFAFLLRPPPGEEDFRLGLRELGQERWLEASKALKAAVEADGQERAELVEIEPGVSEPYLPHYYLGVALYHLRNYEEAWRAWETSERQGVVRQVGAVYEDLFAMRRELVGQALLRAEKLLEGTDDYAASLRQVLDGEELAWLRTDAADLVEAVRGELARLEEVRGRLEAAKVEPDYVEVSEVEIEVRDVKEALLELSGQIDDRLEAAVPDA